MFAAEPRSRVFLNWVEWARRHNEFVIKQADFFTALERRGFQQVKIKGVSCIRGIRLKRTPVTDKYYSKAELHERGITEDELRELKRRAEI